MQISSNSNIIFFYLIHSFSLSNNGRISSLIKYATETSDPVPFKFDIERFKSVFQQRVIYLTLFYRYPSVAAELLSCSIPALLDVLVSTDDVSAPAVPESMPRVDQLLSFIDTTEPLNSLSASFFSKIMTNLHYSRANEVGLVVNNPSRYPSFHPTCRAQV